MIFSILNHRKIMDFYDKLDKKIEVNQKKSKKNVYKKTMSSHGCDVYLEKDNILIIKFNF